MKQLVYNWEPDFTQAVNEWLNIYPDTFDHLRKVQDVQERFIIQAQNQKTLFFDDHVKMAHHIINDVFTDDSAFGDLLHELVIDVKDHSQTVKELMDQLLVGIDDAESLCEVNAFERDF